MIAASIELDVLSVGGGETRSVGEYKKSSNTFVELSGITFEFQD